MFLQSICSKKQHVKKQMREREGEGGGERRGLLGRERAMEGKEKRKKEEKNNFFLSFIEDTCIVLCLWCILLMINMHTILKILSGSCNKSFPLKLHPSVFFWIISFWFIVPNPFLVLLDFLSLVCILDPCLQTCQGQLLVTPVIINPLPPSQTSLLLCHNILTSGEFVSDLYFSGILFAWKET